MPVVISKAGLTKASRLRLAQTLFAKGDDWLRDMLERRKVRLHVYRFASRAHRLESVTTAGEVEKALKAPDVRERLLSQGAVVSYLSPQRFDAFIKAEIDKYAVLVKASGAKAE